MSKFEMLPDSKVIVREFKNVKTILVSPVCDLHYGAEAFIEELWEFHKHQILTTPNMYCVLGGDMINNGTQNSKSGAYKDKVPPSVQKNWLCKELEPLVKAKKIICGVPGNHEKRTSKESDGDILWDVFQILQIPELYRDSRAYIKLNVGEEAAYTGLITHGVFGGKTAGAGLDKLEKFTGDFSGVDFFIAAHAHKGASTFLLKTILNPYANIVITREILAVMATSYTDLEKYASDKCYSRYANKIQYIELFKEKDMKFHW